MAIIEIDAPNGCAAWQLETAACEEFAEMAAVTGIAADIAISNLYHLTGSRFGICESTFRPCMPENSVFASSYNSGRAVNPISRGFGAGHRVVFTADGPTNVYACATCFAPSKAMLNLPVFPIREIVDVTVDGESIPASGFAIYDHREIVWQAGGVGGFPRTQDLTKPTTEDGTWSITVRHGYELPSTTAYIAGLYACELAKLISGTGRCALPATVSSISRQGISFQFVNEAYLERGLVGLPLVDRWILSLNPNRLQGRATISSVDTIRNRARRQTS